MPEYALQGKAEMGDYFFLSLFDVFTVDCVTLCVVMDKTCVLIFVLECVRVCVSEAVCSSFEKKRGRQLAEIEGSDCDLRTKSRAKCFQSPLFSPLFSTFCPRSLISPPPLSLSSSSTAEQSCKEKK